MDERFAIPDAGHHCEKVLGACVADHQASVTVLGGIDDQESVDLPFHTTLARFTSQAVSSNAAWCLQLPTSPWSRR